MPEDTSFRELMARVRAGDPHAALQLVRDYEWAIRLQVRVRLTQPDRSQGDAGVHDPVPPMTETEALTAGRRVGTRRA